ncbi:uncharacterized protein LOC120906730 [Anopheles arabiensis]|uniref:uncharacterized protein LOC120906730 n=1 Tax=Anopheles arabiensis TaxID=7173 RepID=UPI001AAD4958|nr:uncharacterized protein LOC120906730 [Anopheles arabiensis]
MPTTEEIKWSLDAAGIDYPETAKATQLRQLLADNVKKTTSQEMAADKTRGDGDDITSNDEAAAIASLEMKVKRLELEKKLLSLEEEIAELQPTHLKPISMNTIQYIETIVPKFTGEGDEDVCAWIRSLEDIFVMTNVPEPQKLPLLRRSLTSTAVLLAQTTKSKNYEELKGELLKEFNNKPSKEVIYKNLRARHLNANETTLRYLLDMQHIAAAASIPENELVHIIIDGLGDPIHTASMRFMAKSIETLKPLLKEYEYIRTRVQTTVQKSSVQQPRVQIARAEPNQSTPRCLNCRKYGHSENFCRMPIRLPGSCFKCGQTDHVYRNCPQRVQQIAVTTNGPEHLETTPVTEPVFTLNANQEP